ncbi:hypothetical protein Tco_0812780 [Tanacetum coccineum]
MSDSEDSTVTYIAAPPLPDYVSSPEYPPSPDYVPSLEEPQAPRPPDFVLEPVYSKFMPPEDEEDPEEDDDEDPKEDPINYPTDKGDDGDNEDESSDDDEDDEVDIEADDEDEEEEEHPAHADFTAVALLDVDQALSAKETELFETDESVATPPPHPAFRMKARISIPAPVLTLVWSDTEVARLLAISTPPSSPLSPWSSPLPHIPSPPLPPILSPPLPVPSLSLPGSPPVLVSSLAPPASPICPLCYRVMMIRIRVEATSTSHSLPLPTLLPISTPTSSPPLLLPSTNRREDRPEVTLPPRKRLGIALGPRYKVGESSSAAARPTGGLRADYGFIATLDDEIMRDPERYVGYGITDTWDDMVEDMFTDKEREARMSRKAWSISMDASDLARLEVMVLRTQVVAQQAMITELQAADRRGWTVITEMLAVDYKRQVQLIEALKLLKGLQTQMAKFQRQQGPAKGPIQLEIPEEAGSSS